MPSLGPLKRGRETTGEGNLFCFVIFFFLFLSGVVPYLRSPDAVSIFHLFLAWTNPVPSQAVLTASLDQQLANSCAYQAYLEGSLKPQLAGSHS